MGKRLLTPGSVLYAWCDPRETIMSHWVNGKHPSITWEATAILISSTTLVQDPSSSLVLGKSVHCHVLHRMREIKMPSDLF